MVILCNQGCHTHIYIKNGRPYNVLDNKPHDCPMLKMAKLWGGRYNTIPMGYIKEAIFVVYSEISNANISRNIDDILKAFRLSNERLQYIIDRMETQEKQNTEWSNELDDYKDRLVADQHRREEEKQKRERDKHGRFVTGDKL